MEKRVIAYCEENRMLEVGDRVVVGVSGGADSVCLLFLLCSMRERFSLSLRVVHIHHGIREDAQADADYVKGLCEQWSIPFSMLRVNIPEMAKREGLSEEEAGRKARYQAFFDCARAFESQETGNSDPFTDGKNGRSVKIALAHHMGDRAETLLFHLFRGSGLKGLGSIRPTRETEEGYQIIRPLLCLTREEIEAYLEEAGIPYCQDSTNFEDTYCRNRIRHHILPYAEAEICHGAVRHLNEAAELFSETEEYLSGQTKEAYGECVQRMTANRPFREEDDAAIAGADEREMGFRIALSNFLRLHPLIQKRLLLALILELSPGNRDIGGVHVEAVRELFDGETGRERNLPFGILARREYAYVVLEKENLTASCAEKRQESLAISPDVFSEGKAVTYSWGSRTFTFRCFPYEKNAEIPEKTYTKWFNYDKIKNTLLIRTRKTGDYLMIRGGDGKAVRKSLKAYFITEKIPRQKRDEMPLLTQEEHVLWIPGYRISEAYKVDDDTRMILQVEMIDTKKEFLGKEE